MGGPEHVPHTPPGWPFSDRKRNNVHLSKAFKLADFSHDVFAQTKTEAVSSILREAIITGRLRPGDPIRQQDLAEILNVSATPVREALAKLNALGTLQHLPHQGVQVAVPSRQAIDEIFRVRTMLEGMAIEEAVNFIDEERLAYLDELAEDQLPRLLETALDTKDLTPYRMANYRFHRTIYSASGMEIIPELIDTLWARSVVQDGVFFHDWDRIQSAPAEHVEIVDALRKSDGKRARSTLEQHVDKTRRAYLNYLDSLSVDDK